MIKFLIPFITPRVWCHKLKEKYFQYRLEGYPHKAMYYQSIPRFLNTTFSLILMSNFISQCNDIVGCFKTQFHRLNVDIIIQYFCTAHGRNIIRFKFHLTLLIYIFLPNLSLMNISALECCIMHHLISITQYCSLSRLCFRNDVESMLILRLIIWKVHCMRNIT